MHNWHVYILRCRDNTLYTGVTTDLSRRVREHNTGKGAKYTRGRSPLRLVWSEKAHDEGSAKRREAEIKRLTRDQKEALIQS